MTRTLFAWVVSMSVASWTSAATLRGTLRYAGMPSAEALPTFTSGKAALQPSGGSWISVDVDTASSSWVATGLSPGAYQVQVGLARVPLAFPGASAGVAVGHLPSVTLAEGEDKTVELELKYGVHVTLPFDNTGQWPGGTAICPYGPAVPLTFTLAWEQVPHAVRYQARVGRWSCQGWLGETVVDTTNTSVAVTQRAVAGEEFLLLKLLAFDAQGHQLASMPYVSYGTTSSTGHYVHAESGPGRGVHRSSSLFLPQVAHVAGAGGSLWTSDLFLANRTAAPLTVDLYFTPRGADGTANYREAQIEVPANGCRRFEDIVDTLFHTTGAGSLEIATVGVTAASRCATPAPGGGSSGQGYEPIAAGAVASLGGDVRRLGTGGVVKGAARTNLAIVEVWGEAVSVMVRLMDGEGRQLGQRQAELLPLSNVQINDLVLALGGPASLAAGLVTLEVVGGDGRVGAVLSVVDNASNDPTTIPLVPW